MSALNLDAEALYAELAAAVRAMVGPDTSLVGILSGGAWLAERLQHDLKLPGAHGVLSITLHRDDFNSRGMPAQSRQTRLPFEIEGRHVILIDDVLHTGRTIRAAVNELYDFGRPASVQLAVLVDRAGRELPISAAYCAARVSLAREQRLSLERDAAGRLNFQIEALPT
ncbi:MAG: bifunctional pyr operon transcriptional regulator/uracil phosphoribosyltransferase PyrR [Burkholderiaceae bacterium]